MSLKWYVARKWSFEIAWLQNVEVVFFIKNIALFLIMSEYLS